MDKLRAFLAATKKYQFWVLCGATFIISLGCLWLAASGLAQQYKDRKNKIDAGFNNSDVPPEQPNQDRIDFITQQDRKLKDNVWNAWMILYEEQRKNNPLPTDVLGDDWGEQFEKCLNNPKEEMQRPYREQYQTYIKDDFPKLQKMIDLRRPKVDPNAPTDRGAGHGPLGANANIDYEGLVEWDEMDRKKFEDRFEWQQTPSTLAILLAQEDLWVYQALLRVIRNCNAGAEKDKPATAVVKRIDRLDIGQDAASAWIEAERAFTPGSRPGAPGMPTGMPMMPPGGGMPPAMPAAGMGGMPMGPMGPAGSMGGMGGMGPGPMAMGSMAGLSDEQIKQRLIAWRYVDDKGIPLSYDASRPGFAPHPFSEFKMMPIRMSLQMDQRRIPKLLVECANSTMPIVVRRVRVLTTTGPTSLGGMAGGAGHAPSGAAAGSQSESIGSMDIPVEIQAAIHIYNPPDPEKLGKGTAALQANANTAVPPAASGTAPAAPSPGQPAVPAPTGANPPRS
jgi:hypothetical protein